jgi:thioredoxin reductase (NADPH)
MDREAVGDRRREVAEGSGDRLYDVVIVGGGPAGSTAALYAARASLSALVLDKGVGAGALALAARIANYPGLAEETSGIALLEQMRAQASRHGARFVEDVAVLATLRGKTKEVQGAKGTHRGRTLIVATGSMGRTESVPGEERLTGRGVSYCATCDGFFFRDQDVAVAGTTDHAAEEALFLARLAKSVQLLVPTSQPKVSARLAAALAEEKRVRVRLRTRLQEVLGEKAVRAVRIEAPRGEEILPVAAVFIALQGTHPITDFLAGGLATGRDGGLLIDENRATSVPGVFAAGDVTSRRLKQIILAAADGAVAAASAERYLST